VPNVKKTRGLNLPGTPWATSACCGRPLLFFFYFYISTFYYYYYYYYYYSSGKKDMDGKSEHRTITKREVLYVTTLGGDDKLQQKAEVLGEKLVPVPLGPPQIPRELA
jgi:hypothetical protein